MGAFQDPTYCICKHTAPELIPNVHEYAWGATGSFAMASGSLIQSMRIRSRVNFKFLILDFILFACV